MAIELIGPSNRGDASAASAGQGTDKILGRGNGQLGKQAAHVTDIPSYDLWNGVCDRRLANQAIIEA
jgi:hypothetical protein